MKIKKFRTALIVLVLVFVSLTRISRPHKRIHLITQWYQDRNASRYQDLYYSLMKNIENRHISGIHLLQQVDFTRDKFPFSDKKVRTVQLTSTSRLKVSQALEYAQKYLRGQIVILANLDIYFDETISALYESDLDWYTTYFLSRTDHFNHSNTECKYPFMGSMDSFIWIPPLPLPLLSRTDFALGSWVRDHLFILGNREPVII